MTMFAFLAIIPLRGLIVSVIMTTVAAMPTVHEQMHKWTGQENQVRQELPDMLPMLDE